MLLNFNIVVNTPGSPEMPGSMAVQEGLEQSQEKVKHIVCIVDPETLCLVEITVIEGDACH